MSIESKPAKIVRLPVAQRSDDELMLLARGGIPAAFDTIVLKYQRRLARTAHRYVGDLQVVEDVVQDTFIDLYRHLPRYRPEGKLQALLYRMMLNRARMSRRVWRRARLVLIEPPEVAMSPQAEERVLARERQVELQRAIDKLPDRYRRTIALRFGADLNYAEIAEVLGIPVGTVKSRIFSSLRKLERKLGAIEW